MQSWLVCSIFDFTLRYIPSFLLATIAYCSLYLPPTSKVYLI